MPANAPFGFSPVQYLNTAKYNGECRTYWISKTDTNAFYIGDAVISTPGGTNQGIFNNPSVGVQQITKASNGTNANVRGVLVGIGPAALDQGSVNLGYIPATKTQDYLVAVADDPMLLFSVQGDNTGSLSATALGEWAGFTVAAPTGGTKVSATVLTTATLSSVNAVQPLFTVGLLQVPNNSYGPFSIFLVRFNLHEFS